jgi:hypothetical protein
MPTAQAAPRWEYEASPVMHWEKIEKQEDVELKAEIDRAREILKLGDDWDGEGSPAYSAHTLNRATEFLKAHSAKSYALRSAYPPSPRIGPGPNGSIDLHWKQKAWELLANIPKEDNQMAVFYGDDYGAAKIKGSFDPKTVNLGIVNWLMH